MITIGVEEEYLLLDPVSGLPVSRAEKVRAVAGVQPALSADEVHPELLQVQVEVATPVCESLEEVGGHLLRMRHALGAAAEEAGCRLVACAAAPFAPTTPAPITDTPRYRALYTGAPRLVDEQLICGMHVHVAIPGRAAGVAVLNRLRPWLPVLVAMSANSPLWGGTDTGFASWRTVVFGRWPVSGPPPLFAGADDYDRRIQALLDTGVIRDTGQLYWQVRLSERYPTIEVRAMDVQLRADDAVMLAGIVRALVTTFLREEEAGLPMPAPPPEILAAAGWHAARHGMANVLLDPRTHQRRKVGDVVSDLVQYLTPALEEAGDARQVLSLVHRLLQEGSTADLQRRLLRKGTDALLRVLTTQTTAPAL
ncbi:MAG TPA: glutamate--cysteine ligase [Streptomyces sp.]|uniref:carboxylate-amine ligase n=1 Tax=Streptomyces sp. TaxID=1931 RepID=UPI002D6A62B2|nr:glutamate--cysteine ligase [Streptomyces sp.]HZG05450.1 glutamate--cysteine ligase [Streptomyces sp.]